jgi:hypothetical protein
VVTGAEDHDGSYRLLFSHPQMIGDLLRGFVREGWSARLDLQSLERCGEVQIGDRLERREDDLIWRACWREDRTPVYLLIEFQSSVDPFMAVRNMTYVGLRYEALIRQKDLSSAGLLPIVISLVLYNGRRGWSGAREISELIEIVPDGPRRYVPQLRYLLVDVHRESPLEEEPDNLAGLLFALERSRSHEEIDRGVARLAEALGGQDSLELRRSFTAFLRHSLLPARFPGARIPAIQDLEEVRPMLRETVQEWTQQWLEEGRQQGRQEGRQEGRRQGEAQLLTRQLERRFGPLTEADQARIQRADAEELLTWGERLLTARALPEVFGE